MWILIYKPCPWYWYGQLINGTYWGGDKDMAEPLTKTELELMTRQYSWLGPKIDSDIFILEPYERGI
jgi:hypothetical protein